MIRRRRAPERNTVHRLLTDTHDLVDRLLAEIRVLRAENARLAQEVERLTAGWDQVRRLARSAPRSRRARR